MAVKKIDNYNIHQNPSTNTNKFDVENYLNKNWEKTQEVVNNNADELTLAQNKLKEQDTSITSIKEDITNIETEQKEQNTNIEKIQKECEELKEENEKLRNDIDNTIPPVEGEGEVVTLKRTAEARFKEIEISGNEYQETQEEGKNKIPTTSDSWIQGYTAPGTGEFIANDKNGIEVKNFIEVEQNETYHIKLNNPSTYSLRSIVTFDKDRKHVGRIISNPPVWLATDLSFTIPENIKYLKVGLVNSGGNEPLTPEIIPDIQIQLEKDTATDHEEYKPKMPSIEYPSEIKAVGDNGSVNIKVNNGNIAKIDETNWELTKDNTIKNRGKNEGVKLITPINLKKGQTINSYIKVITKPTTSTSFTFFVDDVVNNTPNFSNFQNQNNYNLNQVYKRTYTAIEDCTVLYRMYGNANSETFEFQFWANIDEELKEYVPYQEQNYPVTVQEPMFEGDYFDLERKKEVHTWKKLIWNSIENTTCAGIPQVEGETQVFFHIENTNPLPNGKVLCNKLKGQPCGTSLWSQEHRNEIAINKSGILEVKIDYTLFGCTSDMKDFQMVAPLNTYLQENPMEIWYQTTDTTELDLTEQQITQLEEIKKNAKSYKDVTHIYSTDEVQAKIKAKACADIVSLINSMQTKEVQNEPSTDEPAMEEPSLEPEMETIKEGGAE